MCFNLSAKSNTIVRQRQESWLRTLTNSYLFNKLLKTLFAIFDEDPIYKNSPYADSFVIIQIINGTLGPAGQ